METLTQGSLFESSDEIKALIAVLEKFCSQPLSEAILSYIQKGYLGAAVNGTCIYYSISKACRSTEFTTDLTIELVNMVDNILARGIQDNLNCYAYEVKLRLFK